MTLKIGSMTSPPFDFSSPQGIIVLRSLYSFSDGLFRRLFKTEVNSKGKSAKDYVNDALVKHLLGKDKYDPARGPLDHHLKKNVIMQAQFNDLRKHLKNKMESISVDGGLGEDEALVLDEYRLGKTVPALEESDMKVIFSTIEESIKDDPVVEGIYLAVFYDIYEISDRKEICQACNLQENEFDNGKRRLKTVLNSVYRKYY